MLCLDAHLRKINFKKLFYGSLNSCEISINQLLRYAISEHASSIVIAHNHPFGRAEPSAADLQLDWTHSPGLCLGGNPFNRSLHYLPQKAVFPLLNMA